MKKRLVFVTVLLSMGLSLALMGCDGDDGHDGADGVLFSVESLTPPDGPAGQFTINLSGGDSDTALGGSGGDMDLSIDYGSLGGNIKMFDTGLADAGFTFPENVSTYLGANPLRIEDDTTIAVASAEPEAETPYLVANSDRIFISNGDSIPGNEIPVTGLSVAAGATLTLELNWGGAISARFVLENDVYNAGTLTVANQTGTLNSGNLYIGCDVFHGDAGSSILLAGGDNTAGAGGAGGSLQINMDDSDWGSSESIGHFYNQGTIDTSGGNGSTNGGNAGYIYLYANLTSINTGDMTAVGGDGTTGTGGNGGGIELYTDYGNNWNSGDLNASGGNCTSGGNAGWIEFYVGYVGNILNSGNLTANGGNGSAGNGGYGNFIEFYGYATTIINSGNISAIGGTAVNGNGGGGGSLYAYNYTEYGWYGENIPSGNLEISGNISLAGGSATGGSGGNGGYVDLEVDTYSAPNNQEIILYGYTAVDASGGNGATYGGSGGDIYCEHYYASDWFGDIEGPSGGVVNYIDIAANGGTGGTGIGGDGGWFEIYTEDEYGYVTDGELAYNYADLNLRGGDGNYGGNGGGVFMWGFNGALNQGRIDASGGDSTGDGGSGGDATNGYGVYIISDLGTTENTGSIDASGGDSTGAAGYGGDGALIEIVGYSAVNSGNLSVAGGDADAATGTGGDADAILIYGTFEGATNTASAFDISGGSGSIAGTGGEVFIDGMNVTASWN